jgi:Na+-transporting NADH:ubiquinone oxidoreductase subunit F
MAEIAISVGMFTGIVLALVVLILLARSRLVAAGEVEILINDEQTLSVSPGGKLLNALAAKR